MTRPPPLLFRPPLDGNSRSSTPEIAPNQDIYIDAITSLQRTSDVFKCRIGLIFCGFLCRTTWQTTWWFAHFCKTMNWSNPSHTQARRCARAQATFTPRRHHSDDPRASPLTKIDPPLLTKMGPPIDPAPAPSERVLQEELLRLLNDRALSLRGRRLHLRILDSPAETSPLRFSG